MKSEEGDFELAAAAVLCCSVRSALTGLHAVMQSPAGPVHLSTA